MLNPTFSKSENDSIATPYVINGQFAQNNVSGNEAFHTGPEYRLQKVYGDEIWLKLERAGLNPERFKGANVLEICGGSGFLTYHLLDRCSPESITVNDISPTELAAARSLIQRTYPDIKVSWVLGDMHEIELGLKFDIIIGNSFLHHFHDVPKVLSRLSELLTEDGVFISLHEPTPMSTVVEGAKLFAYPLAVILPRWVNNIARARYKGSSSSTDLWMFEASVIKRVGLAQGFASARIIQWNLLRPIIVQSCNLHLNSEKPILTQAEISKLRWGIFLDSILNHILPTRFFGSISLILRKK